jgi:hypothetical protein
VHEAIYVSHSFLQCMCVAVHSWKLKMLCSALAINTEKLCDVISFHTFWYHFLLAYKKGIFIRSSVMRAQ